MKAGGLSKKDLAEAGRRRLEEFRKSKALKGTATAAEAATSNGGVTSVPQPSSTAYIASSRAAEPEAFTAPTSVPALPAAAAPPKPQLPPNAEPVQSRDLQAPAATPHVAAVVSSHPPTLLGVQAAVEVSGRGGAGAASSTGAAQPAAPVAFAATVNSMPQQAAAHKAHNPLLRPPSGLHVPPVADSLAALSLVAAARSASGIPGANSSSSTSMSAPSSHGAPAVAVQQPWLPPPPAPTAAGVPAAPLWLPPVPAAVPAPPPQQQHQQPWVPGTPSSHAVGEQIQPGEQPVPPPAAAEPTPPSTTSKRSWMDIFAPPPPTPYQPRAAGSASRDGSSSPAAGRGQAAQPFFGSPEAEQQEDGSLASSRPMPPIGVGMGGAGASRGESSSGSPGRPASRGPGGALSWLAGNLLKGSSSSSRPGTAPGIGSDTGERSDEARQHETVWRVQQEPGGLQQDVQADSSYMMSGQQQGAYGVGAASGTHSSSAHASSGPGIDATTASSSASSNAAQPSLLGANAAAASSYAALSDTFAGPPPAATLRVPPSTTGVTGNAALRPQEDEVPSSGPASWMYAADTNGYSTAVSSSPLASSAPLHDAVAGSQGMSHLQGQGQQQQPQPLQQQQKQQPPFSAAGSSQQDLAGPPAPAGVRPAGAQAWASGPPSSSSTRLPGMPATWDAGLAAAQEEKSAALAVLQAHIDELTSEKLELLRGLQQQMKAAEGLAEEQAVLSEQVATLTASLAAERKQVKQYEQELVAHATAVAAMGAERDGYKAAAQEATERSTALAAENVSLDNALLEAKSSLLRAERAVREAASRTDKLEAQLGATSARANAAEQQVEDMTAERRLLLARAMQAEAAVGKVRPSQRPLAPGVDMGVQADVDGGPLRERLPRWLPPAPLSSRMSTAALADSRSQLAAGLQEAGVALGQLAAWLPAELLGEASTAAATGASSKEGDVAGTAPEEAPPASLGSSFAGSAARLVLPGEAAMVGSILEVVAELEAAWTDLGGRLAAAQARIAVLEAGEAAAGIQQDSTAGETAAAATAAAVVGAAGTAAGGVNDTPVQPSAAAGHPTDRRPPADSTLEHHAPGPWPVQHAAPAAPSDMVGSGTGPAGVELQQLLPEPVVAVEGAVGPGQEYVAGAAAGSNSLVAYGGVDAGAPVTPSSWDAGQQQQPAMPPLQPSSSSGKQPGRGSGWLAMFGGGRRVANRSPLV